MEASVNVTQKGSQLERVLAVNITLGVVFTVIIPVAVPAHPPLLPVTVNEVVVVGDSVISFPVELFDQT